VFEIGLLEKIVATHKTLFDLSESDDHFVVVFGSDHGRMSVPEFSGPS
jgi:arylsulfatase A-like enzyme